MLNTQTMFEMELSFTTSELTVLFPMVRADIFPLALFLQEVWASATGHVDLAHHGDVYPVLMIDRWSVQGGSHANSQMRMSVDRLWWGARR